MNAEDIQKLQAATLEIARKFAARLNTRKQKQGVVTLEMVAFMTDAVSEFKSAACTIEHNGTGLSYADAPSVAQMLNTIHAAILGKHGHVTATFMRCVGAASWCECPPSCADIVELHAHSVSVDIPGIGELNGIAATLGSSLLDCIAEICHLTEQPTFDFSDNKDEIERYDITKVINTKEQ